MSPERSRPQDTGARTPDASAVAGRHGGDRAQIVELLALMRRNPDYRNLFLSSVISFLGDWFALVAVSGLVTELTGREGSTALVFAAEVLPIFLFAPLAGVLADRVDRKRMMIGSDLLRVIPALGLLLAAGLGQAWLAYVCVAAISALAAFFQPVASAVVPNVVEDDDLSLAMAGIGSVWGTMLFVGAAIGGLAAQLLGRDASFTLNAATFLVSAVLLWRVRRPFNQAIEVTAAASVFAHLGEVWRFVRPRKVSRALMVTKAGVGVGNGIVGLLPIYALQRYGAGDAGIGILLAARGLGALIGPYLGRRLAREDGRRLIFGAGASIVMYAVAYVFLPFTSSLLVAFVIVTVAHTGGGNQWVASTQGLQMTTPDHVRGRVMSLDFGLATLTMGVSALLAGAAAELFGLTAASLGLVAVSLGYGVGWLIWTRDLWHADHDPITSAARDGLVRPAVG